MKYYGSTIIGLAQKRGSAAKTKAGAWKYLLAHLQKKPFYLRRRSTKYEWDCWREERRNRTGDGRALVLGHALNDPGTPGRIMDEAWAMNHQWDVDCCHSVSRDKYGEVWTVFDPGARRSRPEPEISQVRDAWSLINLAQEKGIIPAEYDTIEFDRKGRADGDALHHELFDFSKNAAIICLRRTEGSRYGVRTISKTYMLVESYRRKITAREITIPVAKYAKMGILHYGDIIAIAQGKKQVKLINATNKIRHGYKAVRVTDDGKYVSVWDGSEWKIGETRIEKAQQDHNGGLYYYQSLPAMLQDARESSIFAEDMQHHRLAVLEVEATGTHISYGNKFAATRITPTRQIMSIV